MNRATAEFIAGYLEGDGSAVAEVDRWIAGAARPFSRRLGGDWDDVQQDLRLEVYRVLESGQYRGDSSLKTYVWRVVSHTCLDHIRKESKWAWTDVEGSSRAQAIGDTLERRRRVAYETRDLLLRVLEKVSEDCRRLWRLIVEGYSYKEMSDKLGVSEGALRVRVLRCRRQALRIREELAAEGRA